MTSWSMRDDPHVVETNGKLGASRSVIESSDWEWPLHGLRHPAQGDTTGWYLWTGELQQDAGFFLPWHVAHVLDRCRDLQPLLELPPGSRFGAGRTTGSAGQSVPTSTASPTIRATRGPEMRRKPARLRRV